MLRGGLCSADLVGQHSGPSVIMLFPVGDMVTIEATVVSVHDTGYAGALGELSGFR